MCCPRAQAVWQTFSAACGITASVCLPGLFLGHLPALVPGLPHPWGSDPNAQVCTQGLYRVMKTVARRAAGSGDQELG